MDTPKETQRELVDEKYLNFVRQRAATFNLQAKAKLEIIEQMAEMVSVAKDNYKAKRKS